MLADNILLGCGKPGLAPGRKGGRGEGQEDGGGGKGDGGKRHKGGRGGQDMVVEAAKEMVAELVPRLLDRGGR